MELLALVFAAVAGGLAGVVGASRAARRYRRLWREAVTTISSLTDEDAKTDAMLAAISSGKRPGCTGRSYEPAHELTLMEKTESGDWSCPHCGKFLSNGSYQEARRAAEAIR